MIKGDNTKCFVYKKEEDDMAVFAKPMNKMVVVKKEESQEFIREFNENKVTREFLDSCKKAGKLFDNKTMR